MQKHMKNRTYHNIMRTVNAIQRKGYDFETAKEIAFRLWDSFNPLGLSMEAMIQQIIPASEH